MDRLADLRAVSPTFWNWLAPERGSTEKPKSEGRTGLTFSSTMDDGSVVLGTLELENETLLVSVNSETRAKRARAMLAPVLA